MLKNNHQLEGFQVEGFQDIQGTRFMPTWVCCSGKKNRSALSTKVMMLERG
jgi:hypothetical protein